MVRDSNEDVYFVAELIVDSPQIEWSVDVAKNEQKPKSKRKKQ